MWYLSRGWTAPMSSKCETSYMRYKWLSHSWFCRRVTIIASGIVLGNISLRPPWKFVIFTIKKLFPASQCPKRAHTVLKTEAPVTAQQRAWTWNCLSRPENYLFPFVRKYFPGSKYQTKYFISCWKQKHWSLSYQSFGFPRWSALHDIPSLLCIMQLLAATWSCISRRFSPYPLCQCHGRHVGASKVFSFSKLNYFIFGYFDSRNLETVSPLSIQTR